VHHWGDRDGVIVVWARTAAGPVPCPRRADLTGHVHGYYERTVAGRARRWAPGGGACAGAADALPGPGLPGADVPRANPGDCWTACAPARTSLAARLRRAGV